MEAFESLYIIKLEISPQRAFYLQEILHTLDCSWVNDITFATYYGNYEKAERVSQVINKLHFATDKDELYCTVEEVPFLEEEE